jgi:hypothetical protein
MMSNDDQLRAEARDVKIHDRFVGPVLETTGLEQNMRPATLLERLVFEAKVARRWGWVRVDRGVLILSSSETSTPWQDLMDASAGLEVSA